MGHDACKLHTWSADARPVAFPNSGFLPTGSSTQPFVPSKRPGGAFFQWDQVFCCIQNCPGPARFGGSCLQHLEAGKTVRVVYGVIYPWDFARRQCLHWNICAGWMHKVEGKKESVAWLLQNSNRHEAMSCINYMKGQISLGEPHSIEGHHRPALSRLARVPRPASSESAKQQWVCKKNEGSQDLEGASSRAPKDCTKGPTFESTLLGEISSAQRSHGRMPGWNPPWEPGLWANLRFKLVSSAVSLAPSSTASQIWLSASAKVANLKVVQPKSCNTEASFLSRPSTPAKVTRLSIARRSYRPLTSQKGIWTTHYGTLHDVPGWIHFAFRLCWFSGGSILKHTVQGSNSSPQNWKVRNPASQLQLCGVLPENADLRP